MARIYETPMTKDLPSIKAEVLKAFDELPFVSCPTEEQEPCFWRWTAEGRDKLIHFLESSIEALAEAMAGIIQLEDKTFPERESDEYDAGYAKAKANLDHGIQTFMGKADNNEITQ